jgi:hypothetical protein
MSKVIINKENNNEGNAGDSLKMCHRDTVCAGSVPTGDAQMSTYLIWGNTRELLGLLSKRDVCPA